jgi:hypothetical protein
MINQNVNENKTQFASSVFQLVHAVEYLNISKVLKKYQHQEKAIRENLNEHNANNLAMLVKFADKLKEFRENQKKNNKEDEKEKTNVEIIPDLTQNYGKKLKNLNKTTNESDLEAFYKEKNIFPNSNNSVDKLINFIQLKKIIDKKDGKDSNVKQDELSYNDNNQGIQGQMENIFNLKNKKDLEDIEQQKYEIELQELKNKNEYFINIKNMEDDI